MYKICESKKPKMKEKLLISASETVAPKKLVLKTVVELKALTNGPKQKKKIEIFFSNNKG